MRKFLFIVAILFASTANAQFTPYPGSGSGGGNGPTGKPPGQTFNNSVFNSSVFNDSSLFGSNLPAQEFWANTFPGCTWDSTHDVGPCIIAAQTAAMGSGGGTVRIPAGVFGISTQYVNRMSGVKLRGAGKGRPQDNRAGYFPVTVLKWIGTSGTDVIVNSPATNLVSGSILVDAGVTDLMIDGNRLAATGIHNSSVRDSTFDVSVINTTTACMQNDTAQISEGNDTQGNTISMWCNNQSTDGDGILGIGTSGASPPLSGNVSINSFPFLTIFTRNGWAIHFTYSDNNQFGVVDTFHLGPVASFTGSITTNVLTVTAVASGTLINNQYLYGISLLPGTQITGQLTGTTGGIGTYSVSISQTSASNAITASIGGSVLFDSTANATDFNGGNNFAYLNSNGGAILLNGSRTLNNNFYHLDYSNATPAPQYGNGAAEVPTYLHALPNGSISVDVPDNQVTGGQIRGANSIDLQHTRPAYPYVAQGVRDQILGGSNNRAGGGPDCYIWAGQWNECGGIMQWIIGQFINEGGRSNIIGYGGPGVLQGVHIVQTGLTTFAANVTTTSRTRLLSDTLGASANNTAALLGDNRSSTLICKMQVKSASGSDAANFFMEGPNSAELTRGTGVASTALVPSSGVWVAGHATAGAIGILTPDISADTTFGGFNIGITASSGSWYAYASCQLVED